MTVETVSIKETTWGKIILSDHEIESSVFEMMRGSPSKRQGFNVGTLWGFTVGIKDIIIEKTTPEEDQKRVCAAVKSLEDQFRKRDEHRAELQRLADGCK